MAELRQQNQATHVVLPLIDRSARPQYKIGPTLAAGDVKVLRHTGGSYDVSNIGTLPTQIGSTGMLDITLTATEMNPDDTDFPIIIQFIDVAGDEWDDNAIEIYVKPIRTNVKEINDGDLAGNNAVLKLAQLDINHPTASALKINTGGATSAINVTAAASGGIGVLINADLQAMTLASTSSHGVSIVGSSTGSTHALFLQSQSATGSALKLKNTTAGGLGMDIETSGVGLKVLSSTTHGVEIKGSTVSGSGHGILIDVPTGTGHGVTITGKNAGLILRGGTGKDIDAVEITDILLDTGTSLPATLALILADTGTDIPATLALILADTGTDIPATLALILADTGTDIPASIAALNDISTAEVKTQIDNALTVDTIAELAQATPDTTPTIAKALMMLYMIGRNNGTQTATLKKFFNDAGVNVFSQVVSATISQYSQAKMIPGT